jgi:hypothetical protein
VPGVLPRPADERPHRPGPDPDRPDADRPDPDRPDADRPDADWPGADWPGADWEESWHFDFAAHDGSLAGFVRVTLRPGDGAAWYWAYLAGPRRAVVVVRDHELEPPPGRTLELRGPGLWAQVICETPLDHWSAGLEAAGVALDDPAEGLRGERGDPVPLGLDLEWEAIGPPASEESGYGQSATVHGEVLLGSRRLDVDARGWWVHRWGAPPWRTDGWWWAAGSFDDGTAIAAGASVVASELTMARSGTGPTSPMRLAGGGAEVTLTPAAWALVPLPGPRGLARALCSWSAADKRGWGWCEWLQTRAP